MFYLDKGINFNRSPKRKRDLADELDKDEDNQFMDDELVDDEDT